MSAKRHKRHEEGRRGNHYNDCQKILRGMRYWKRLAGVPRILHPKCKLFRTSRTAGGVKINSGIFRLDEGPDELHAKRELRREILRDRSRPEQRVCIWRVFRDPYRG